ncbi:hypothetical protein M434DRAFT_10760 [Hypoxylon sp. CO27-5]|nr:hypothetical protein M434DRAFT_10760 [Hypoxylon sp. CO27-5]
MFSDISKPDGPDAGQYLVVRLVAIDGQPAPWARRGCRVAQGIRPQACRIQVGKHVGSYLAFVQCVVDFLNNTLFDEASCPVLERKMCIQYLYHSLCQNPSCEIIIGRRHRNNWCGEARRARRLGHCTPGLQITDPICTHEQTVRCAKCKRLQQNQGGCKTESQNQDGDQDRDRDGSSVNVLNGITMGPVTRSQSTCLQGQGNLGVTVHSGVDLFDHVFANPLAEAEAELEEEAMGSAAATQAQAPEDDEREVFVVRTPEEEARASTRGRGRSRGRPRGSGRGRGSSRNQRQTSKGTSGAREILDEEHLPYGFPAEGETNRPLAPVEDLYIWEEDSDE